MFSLNPLVPSNKGIHEALLFDPAGALPMPSPEDPVRTILIAGGDEGGWDGGFFGVLSELSRVAGREERDGIKRRTFC